MSAIVEPPTMPPSDNLDGLLRAFFRSQLPQPWPPPRVISLSVTTCQRRPARSRSLVRSRWALAASIALLMLSSLFLPSRFAPDANSDRGPNGPILSDIPRDMPKEHKKQKPVEKNNKPGFAADEGEQHLDFEGSGLLFLK